MQTYKRRNATKRLDRPDVLLTSRGSDYVIVAKTQWSCSGLISPPLESGQKRAAAAGGSDKKPQSKWTFSSSLASQHREINILSNLIPT